MYRQPIAVCVNHLIKHFYDVTREIMYTHGPVLIGEVSQTNDDNTDNRFYESMGRFPEINEDGSPLRLLCQEYTNVKGGTGTHISSEGV